MLRKGERCTESSAHINEFAEKSFSKNFKKSCTLSVLGMVFSLMTKGECWVSSSEIIILVDGKSQLKNVAIVGNAMKFKKTVNVMMLQSFILIR